MRLVKRDSFKEVCYIYSYLQDFTFFYLSFDIYWKQLKPLKTAINILDSTKEPLRARLLKSPLLLKVRGF